MQKRSEIKPSLKDLWDGRPTFLEGRVIGPYVVRPALAFGRAAGGVVSVLIPSALKQETAGAATKRVSGFLKRNFLDIGIISSTSFFFAVWSLGSLPLTVAAGASLAGVVGLRGYQEIFGSSKKSDPEILNKKGGLSLFLNRPGAAFTLSSLTNLATCLYIAGMAAMGSIPSLGSSVAGVTKFASLMTFGFLFSAANNIKAARLDRERGYDVKPFLPFRKMNASWSEKLSVIGNTARNFLAGPAIGLISLPIMREALKFSRRDKDYELKQGVSYTDQKISPRYGWKKPKSDSGMSRTVTGLASLSAAAVAGVAGDFKAAVSLAYPAMAMFILGEKSHESYAIKRQKSEQNHPQPKL